MPLSNQFVDDILEVLFRHTGTMPNIGDATGIGLPATVGNVELALSTAALNDTHTLMTQTEVAYTGYARPNIVRSSAGWDLVAGVSVDNAALIQFGEMSAGGPVTATDLALTFFQGAEYLQIFGVLDNPLVINNVINPQFVAGALVVTLV